MMRPTDRIYAYLYLPAVEIMKISNLTVSAEEQTLSFPRIRLAFD